MTPDKDRRSEHIADTWSLILSLIVLPVILLAPIWGWLRSWVGVEGAALIAIILQVVFLFSVRDRLQTRILRLLRAQR